MNAGVMREELVNELISVSGAKAGLYYSITRDQTDNVHRFYNMIAVGPTDFVDAFIQMSGMAMHELLGASRMDFAKLLDAITDTQSFQRQTHAMMPKGIADCWTRANVRECNGTNVFHADRYLGWIGVFSDSTLDACGALSSMLNHVVGTLSDAHDLESCSQSEFVDEAAIVGADGRCLRASAPVMTWLEQPTASKRIAELLEALRREARTHSGPVAVLDRVLEIELLEDGRAVLLFRVLEAAELRVIGRLTHRQRNVMARAAGGRSAKEIAEELGLSASTVRGYIKEIYERLGIASRAELAQEVLRFVK